MSNYVVTNEYGHALKLGTDGMLWVPTPRTGGTLFTSRRRALAAVARTERYAKERGLDWGDHVVWRVS
jgi:hypothetical protein